MRGGELRAHSTGRAAVPCARLVMLMTLRDWPLSYRGCRAHATGAGLLLILQPPGADLGVLFDISLRRNATGAAAIVPPPPPWMLEGYPDLRRLPPCRGPGKRLPLPARAIVQEPHRTGAESCSGGRKLIVRGENLIIAKKHNAPPGHDYDPISGEDANVSYGTVRSVSGQGKRTLADVIVKRLSPVDRPQEPAAPWPTPRYLI